MSSNRKPLNFNDLRRLKPGALREIEQPPPSDVAPPSNVPPTTDTAPPPDATPTPDVAPPHLQQPPLQSVAPTPPAAATPDVAPEQFTRVVNGIFDKILPTLKPAEQLVLLRLYRLTRGFNTNVCRVTIGRLATTCNIGTTAARLATQSLETKGYIRRIGTDMANTNQNDRGIDFEMLLPAAAPTRRGAATRPVAPTSHVAPPPDVANKEKNLNENTHKEGVRVGSRFTLEECRRYAEHLRSRGEGITNPGGYATAIHRSGESDAQIEKFLAGDVTTEPVRCDLCREMDGFVWADPSDRSKGLKKCKHEGQPNL